MKIDTPSKPRRIVQFLVNLAEPVINVKNAVKSVPRYIRFFGDLLKYTRPQGGERVPILDLGPSIHDR
jgi:hypothetical protein